MLSIINKSQREMDTGVKNRLIEFIKYKGLATKAFEVRCNLSNGYVASIRSGLGADKLRNVLSEFPELNREWLLYGEGSMLTASNSPTSVPNTPTNDLLAGACVVPVVPVSAQGGSLNDFVVSIRERDCEKIVSPVSDADFALTVSGESMAPEYPNGAIVLVKRINERAFINWGHVHVLDTCNGTVIKRLLPVKDDPSCVTCRSINPDYPEFTVSLRDIYAIYRVVLCMSVK